MKVHEPSLSKNLLLQDGSCYGGDELMYAGITAEPVKKDFISHVYIFKFLSIAGC